MKAFFLPVLHLLMLFLTLSCGHRLHKAQFYNKLGEQNASDEGYHANEAARLLEFNKINKSANQQHAKRVQGKLNEDLEELNKPNRYNSKEQKVKKKKFQFYM